jgi:hypothetical protein
MSECICLSDRMPSVALRQAEWTPDEARHLRECGSCRQEWELVQAVIGLGHASPRLRDPSATARAVLQRLAQKEARSSRGLWAGSGLAAAAAVVLAVWLGARETSRAEPREAAAVVAGLQMPLPELESLQPAELESVLQTMDDSVSDEDAAADAGLADLDGDELEEVLDTWEG